MAERKFKLDIFDILGRISQKKRNFTEEELKSVIPMVIMRWMSGTKNEHQILGLNQFTNKYCWALTNHKELLINLMSITTPGKYTRYFWLKREVKQTKTKLCEGVVAEYYRYPMRRAGEAANMLDDETILAHAEELGYQKEQLRDLKKELKTR